MSIFTISHNTFPNQRTDETTILVTRKHWIKLFNPLFLIFLASLAPLVFYVFVRNTDWYETFASLYRFGVVFYFLILWNVTFYSIMIYLLNTVTITSKRIIENEQRGLFRHNIDEVTLRNIEDMSTRVFGLWATFLDYGSIEIQSAAAQNIFHLKYLPHPEKIKKIIMTHLYYLRRNDSRPT